MEGSALRRLVIDQDSTLRHAAAAIDRGAVEIALVVEEGDRLVGTFTDGDLRRALLSGAVLEDSVHRYVNRQPWTVNEDADRAAVLDVMQARAISQVPIVSPSGALVGLHVLHDLLGREPRANGAVIMAGGRGTRLGNLTASTPKPMLKVAGRPILERLVLHLVGAGIRNILLATNYMSHVIEEHFGDGSGFGCRIEYLVEDPDVPLGTAGSLSLINPASPLLRHPILVLNGDLVTDFSVSNILRTHRSSAPMMTMAIRSYDHQIPFGVVDIHADEVTGLREKPVASWSVNAGIMVIEPDIVERVVPARMTHMTDLVADCLTRGEKVVAWELGSEWQDVGRPAELRQARGDV